MQTVSPADMSLRYTCDYILSFWWCPSERLMISRSTHSLARRSSTVQSVHELFLNRERMCMNSTWMSRKGIFYLFVRTISAEFWTWAGICRICGQLGILEMCWLALQLTNLTHKSSFTTGQYQFFTFIYYTWSPLFFTTCAYRLPR